jgi:amphi-Trp domain-containing protein
MLTCGTDPQGAELENVTMAENEINVESMLELPQAVAYLEDIVRSLKEGHVYVEHGDNKLEMTPEPNVKVGLKAKQKRDKQSISLKISWRSTPPAGKIEDGFKISAEKAGKRATKDEETPGIVRGVEE